jgi:hypothetical protein
MRSTGDTFRLELRRSCLLFAHTVLDAAEKSLHIKAVNPVQYFHILEAGDSSEQRKIIDEQIKANSKVIDTFMA